MLKKKRAYDTPTAGGTFNTLHFVFHFAEREKILPLFYALLFMTSKKKGKRTAEGEVLK